MYKIGKQQELMYSTGNYTQYLIINCNGKEFGKEYICTYFCCTLLTNTTLSINYSII